MVVRPKPWMFTAGLLIGITLSAAAFCADSASVRLPGNPPAAEDLVAAGATSALAPARNLSMRVVMALRNQAELTQLLADQQDPSSPEYHHWLTPDEFTARFGPTPDDLAQVSAWLTQQGFTVTSASSSDRFVRFTGSAGQASAAFQTSFAATPDGHYFANVARPAVPASLTGLIQSIVGLDNLHGLGATPTPQPEYKITGAGSKKYAFGPADMYSFYDESPLLDDSNGTIDGSGADCIAVDEWSDFDDASVAKFNSTFGLSALTDGSTLVHVAVDGASSVISGDEFEALLDIEYSHTAAPGTPIRVYIASPDVAVTDGFLDTLQQAVTDNLCGSISLSIFVCSADSSDAADLATSADTIYQQAASQGQTVFTAAGDDGSVGVTFNTKKGCIAAKTQSVIETAASPNITSVGGTQATPKYNKKGTNAGIATGHSTESVWNEPKYGVGGGGKSAVFAKPTYQTGVTPSDNARDIPDISLLASVLSPGYLFGMNLDNGEGPQVYCCGGGTSFASPYWAGIAALMEQMNGGGSDGRLGPINTELYSLASSNAAKYGILDVTNGKNGFKGVKGFKAVPGYDQATGWGTPDINTFTHAYTGK
jgi:subtilase family serine protease